MVSGTTLLVTGITGLIAGFVEVLVLIQSYQNIIEGEHWLYLFLILVAIVLTYTFSIISFYKWKNNNLTDQNKNH